MFCFTLGATIIPQSLITLQTTDVVSANSTEVKPFQVNPQTLDILFSIISIANWLVIPLVFVMWAATAVMLRSYSRKFGVRKYWIMISAPLVSVIIGTISWFILLPSLTSIFDEKAIPYTMLAFGGILTEGLLLGFAFIRSSESIRNITHNHSKVNDYLGITAKGVALLFVSFFANPSAGSYLPFGVIAYSFFAFGAYLFCTGIYSSAISIASDQKLRNLIRNSLLSDSKLVNEIGLANLSIEREQEVRNMADRHREDIEAETGIESSTSEDETKCYIDQVIAELRKGSQ
jgi:hypothetical protein